MAKPKDNNYPSKTLTPELLAQVREASDILGEHIEWVKYKKIYWVHVTVQDSNHDGDETVNHIITDENVLELLNMNRRGKTPISFTAAYKHHWIRYRLHREEHSFNKYLEQFKKYIVFRPGELTVRTPVEPPPKLKTDTWH